MRQVNRSRDRRNIALPVWRSWIDALSAAVRAEAEYPPRAKIRADFEALRRTVEQLQYILWNPTMLGHLLDGDEGLPYRELHAQLRDVAEKAEERLARIKPRGPGKLYPTAPPTGPLPSARELCALMAGVVWQRDHGRWPDRRNRAVQGLCERLWRLAGAPQRRAWGGVTAGSTAVWEKHLRSARQHCSTPVGLWVAQSLTKRSHPPQPRRWGLK